MIEAIFFDYAGVLAEPSASFIYKELIKRGKSFTLERFREAVINEECSIGDLGTIDRRLNTKYRDLDLTSSEIMDVVKNSRRYEETWDIVKSIQSKKYIVGLVSDQSAEAARIIREQNKDIEVIFNPILFSAEVKLSKTRRDIFDSARESIKFSQDDASKILMIDDREHVLATVRGAGWNGLLYTNPKNLLDGLNLYGI